MVYAAAPSVANIFMTDGNLKKPSSHFSPFQLWTNGTIKDFSWYTLCVNSRGEQGISQFLEGFSAHWQTGWCEKVHPLTASHCVMYPK